MSEQYPGVDVFHDTIPLPDDGNDWPAFVAAVKNLGDRTMSLKLSRDAIADVAALKAIDTTSFKDGAVRHVSPVGFYVFDATSVEPEHFPYVVAPTTGPGRWIGDVPHETSRVVVVQAACVRGITSSPVLVQNRELGVDFVPFTSADLDSLQNGGARHFSFTSSDAYSHGLLFPITEDVIDGAVLVSARCRFDPPNTHPALPLVMPAFGVRRVPRTGTLPQALKSTNAGFALDPSPDVAAYDAEHDWTWTADQNNTIDRAAYSYDIVAFYEGHINSLFGGRWVSFELTFSGRIPPRARPT